ncbi:MAG: hypothetical protein HND52_13650 [Ignavibacteriae bacterium]|nr:hypothetical protein [Ignavibacteriota bacterium]NOG98998.1 hypothetical protein [Ignavibacteriota bacterium]
MNDNLSQTPAAAIKYLNKNTSSKWKIELPTTGLFKLIIVIPAINEYENLEPLLKSLIDNDSNDFSKTLFLFVINNLASSDESVKENNAKSLSLLSNIINKQKIKSEKLNSPEKELNIALIDASSKGNELPEKDGGVGLARKMGMDAALNLFDYKSPGKNIIGCLDADCRVSNNYISEIFKNFNTNNLSAAHVNFTHPVRGHDKEKAAIICYEIFLRYYLLGLKTADSPYAFFTIGSTMFCDVESYVKIGGMNKRKAAEDFYFMEKLAKITKIEVIENAWVYPSGRGSWRVPFGTGQRVNRFLEGTHEEYTLYSIKSFLVLKDWLKIFMNGEVLKADEYLNEAKKIKKELHQFLIKNNFEKSWNKILANSQNEKQINKQKIIWFDGFRTLKLIHYLRDTCFKNEPMFSQLDKIFELNNAPKKFNSGQELIPPLNIQQDYLKHLKSLT